MKNLITCEICGDILTVTTITGEYTCGCERYVIESHKCPECGCDVFAYNDPALDTTLGCYCSNKDCNYTENQYCDWRFIKEELMDENN